MPEYLNQKEACNCISTEISRECVANVTALINYYGTPISSEDWKEVGLQFNLYIKKLKEEIERKLKSHQSPCI